MRERLARSVAVLTVTSLIGLSVLFAEAQNPRATEPIADETRPFQESGGHEAPPVDTVRARALFTELGCGACHAVGDMGNPRNPLDGIGSRRTPASIRAWTIGEGAVADSLSPAALRVKRSYVDVPESDLELLASWLAGLKGEG